jgi:hypothetical protein
MGDWEKEMPNALRVRRLDRDPGEPLSEAEMAQRAAKYMVSDVYLLYWFTRLNYNGPVNIMRAPRGSGPVGGLRTQMGSQGVIRLEDDEAMIVTSNIAGAAYRDFVLHDVWYRTIEYWKRQSSLCNAQMTLNEDGRCTMVVSHSDPGVANWLDTGGLREIYALHRWQGLPVNGGPEAPKVESEIIKLRDLQSKLPAGVGHMTPAEREAQLKRRRTAFLRRFIDS